MKKNHFTIAIYLNHNNYTINMIDLTGKILSTGGTGSLGKA